VAVVVNDDLHVGFAHIQRTGGRSMTKALMRLPGSRRVFPDHSMDKPSGTDGYFWFLTMRDPFTREWSHYSRRHGKGKRHWIRQAVRRMTFAEYVAAHVADPARWEDHCQAEWIRRIRPDLILRFEELPTCLARLPFAIGDYPHCNASRRPMPPDAYSRETTALVRRWAAEDFSLLRYDSRD
jgi:hypothetical protein